MNKDTLRLVAIAAVSAAVIVSITQLSYTKPEEPVMTPVSAVTLPTPTPTVAFVPVKGESPDGKKTLTMDRRIDTANMVYSFTVTDNGDHTEHLVATKTVPSTDTFTIPENSWSPDNKYAFVKGKTGTQNSYFVFAASDTLRFQELQNLDIQTLFAEKHPASVLKEITGWAAPYLLILNTEAADGTAGPSYWFDISTKSFIRLATRF